MIFTKQKQYTIYNASCLDVMDSMEENSVDAIVTDPPYEIGFMNKGWDNTGIAFDINTWKKALRVLKPGGYLLAFNHSRTFHRMMVAIEDAGFELRDTIMWLYGSGFPKSHNIAKAIDKMNGKHEIDLKPFGDYIKFKREKYGYSRKELDGIMGTCTAVSWWEGRKAGVQLPSLKTYNKLKEVLNLDNRFDDLIEWQEAEREIVGTKLSGIANPDDKNRHTIGGSKAIEVDITIPATLEAKQWEGYGTALKPAHEDICVAQKPFENSSNILYNEIKEVALCLLKSFVKIAEKNFMLNQVEQNEVQNIAQWIAGKTINTKEDLLEVMGMLQSKSMVNMNLNTVLLWLNTLVELWVAENTYIISTATRPTIELKILKSLEWESILANIIQVKNNDQLGTQQDVLYAINIFNAVKLKLNYIKEHFAHENATSLVKNKTLHPNFEPIVMARKPFNTSVAENVLTYGVGGINIDECRVKFGNESDNRVGTDVKRGDSKKYKYEPIDDDILQDWENDLDYVWSEKTNQWGNEKQLKENLKDYFMDNIIIQFNYKDYENILIDTERKRLVPLLDTYKNILNSNSMFGQSNKGVQMYKGNGRFPANVIHDGSKEATHNMWDWETDNDASRYFYCAKASKKDRDEGLSEFDKKFTASAEFRPNHMEKALQGEDGNPYGRWKPRKNIHPTVKPTDLMQYLVRLVTPRGGTVLDIFMGSGSTGKATMIENVERDANYHFIGIDLEKEYCEIAQGRIEWGINFRDLQDEVVVYEDGEKKIAVQDKLDLEF